MAFDERFENWLTDRLASIKALSLNSTHSVTSPIAFRTTSGMTNMSSSKSPRHPVASPTGNYYRLFAYDEDDNEDDDDDDDDTNIPAVTHADHVTSSPATNDNDVTGDAQLSRRARLSRLLGPDAVAGLDIGDELDDVTNTAERRDENENVYSGGHVDNQGRIQNYSTTSLEFSDVDSYGTAASDPAAIVDQQTAPAEWTMDDVDDEQFYAHEPVQFVQFARTAATGTEGDREMARRLFDEEADGGGGDDVAGRTANRGPSPPAAGGHGRNAAERSPQRLDDVVTVRFTKASLYEATDPADDFIDDDDILAQKPVGVTSKDDVIGKRSAVPSHGILPTDGMEMTLENSDEDEAGEDPVTKDRDPIVRGDCESRRPLNAPTCCRRHRKLLIGVAVVTCVVLATALGVIIFFVVHSAT